MKMQLKGIFVCLFLILWIPILLFVIKLSSNAEQTYWLHATQLPAFVSFSKSKILAEFHHQVLCMSSVTINL